MALTVRDRKNRPALAAIVAMNEQRVIGKGGDLPWRIREDLRRFRSITMGHVIIMGRKTYDSIGKPLGGRANFVISRAPRQIPGCRMFSSIERAIAAARGQDPTPFIIGGASIYEATLPRVTQLYVTKVNRVVKGGDVFFPEVDWSEWEERKREVATTDDDVTFCQYSRR